VADRQYTNPPESVSAGPVVTRPLEGRATIYTVEWS
jgi:hypothetical protein